MLTDFATGAAREPAGWDAVEAMETPSRPDYFCVAFLIGRYVAAGRLRRTGGTDDPFFLNHRTGRQITQPAGVFNSDRINLDYAGLVTPHCAPVREAWMLHTSLPPFTLQALTSRFNEEYEGPSSGAAFSRTLGVRRCSQSRAAAHTFRWNYEN